jgi:hypothetical protein
LEATTNPSTKSKTILTFSVPISENSLSKKIYSDIEIIKQFRQYQRFMPFPNIPNAPFTFNGTNVNEFLKRYYDVAVDCGLDEREMAKRSPKYCEYTITGPFIELMEV